MALKDVVGQWGKAIVGGFGGALISILSTTVTDPDSFINPDAPDSANAIVQLPNTGAEWLTFAIAIAIGFGFPWLKRNYPSVADALAAYKLAEQRKAEGKQTK